MGRVYALHDGVPGEVADAIFEHYLPRGAEERLPSGDTGALLGMADRLDLLVGLFGLGKEPSGTADPYGLRRAALGILRVTLARGYRFDMDEALRAAQKLHGKDDGAAREKVWQFLLGRLEVLLRDKATARLHPGGAAHRRARPGGAGEAPGRAADRPREEPGAVRGHRSCLQAHRQHPAPGAAEGVLAGGLPRRAVQAAGRAGARGGPGAEPATRLRRRWKKRTRTTWPPTRRSRSCGRWPTVSSTT